MKQKILVVFDVEDGTYKAGVVYGLQTASFNALRSARKYYKKSKQASVGSVLQLQLLAKMEAANEISMQTRAVSRAAWASTG